MHFRNSHPQPSAGGATKRRARRHSTMSVLHSGEAAPAAGAPDFRVLYRDRHMLVTPDEVIVAPRAPFERARRIPIDNIYQVRIGTVRPAPERAHAFSIAALVRSWRSREIEAAQKAGATNATEPRRTIILYLKFEHDRQLNIHAASAEDAFLSIRNGVQTVASYASGAGALAGHRLHAPHVVV